MGDCNRGLGGLALGFLKGFHSIYSLESMGYLGFGCWNWVKVCIVIRSNKDPV